MAWGLVLGGRRYDAIDYICAGTVTFGCALFVLTGSIAAPQLAAATVARGASGAEGGLGGSGDAAGGRGGEWMVYGLLLLAAFLLFDGLTSTTQDKLFAQYEMHSVNQLLWVSVWSAGVRWGGGWCVWVWEGGRGGGFIR
jgi:adenosine 3'-phospho 5'-phosphosulfate transporter B2